MRRLVLFTICAAIAASAPAMPVSTFLGKVEALKAKGALALFSGDVKLLKDQMTRDSEQLRAENISLQAAGKPKLYCSPKGSRLTQTDLLAAMNEVPSSLRARTSTKDAIRNYIAKRHPCRAN